MTLRVSPRKFDEQEPAKLRRNVEVDFHGEHLSNAPTNHPEATKACDEARQQAVLEPASASYEHAGDENDSVGAEYPLSIFFNGA